MIHEHRPTETWDPTMSPVQPASRSARLGFRAGQALRQEGSLGANRKASALRDLSGLNKLLVAVGKDAELVE